ncbi:MULTISPECIES: hypothetical protein [unclassified Halomonas]|uniref:hypothetical protein n=1 Tax=unclassified Halomonas TaxID=2609666 RepID=UPI0006D9C771|nr:MULTISPECIES: hypothetical protein [unclassified Halomonas]KPQ22251.1 MAG: hypothetical protein HLUCCO06_05015 [Halomonas sp. HL-93]SBR48199.1 hypothetical protein GA0071314_1583 [Halomonas sp. HL-93]SNY95797.1 hypothetical protein SAMN04488142_0307 [Halomonas sp. hl-4]
MKIMQINQTAQQDACLARLCAEVYGQTAGLTPLVVFTGTRNVLLAEEAARLLAAVDGEGAPQALALLVLDEQGEGMSLTHACDLDDLEAKAWLVGELALKAPLRVDACDAKQEAFYQQCGMKRWLDGAEGQRIGLSTRHPAQTVDELAETVTIDEALILRRFKHDPAAFEQAKQLFIDGLAHFPKAF